MLSSISSFSESASSSTSAHEGEAVAWGRAEGRVIPSLRALSKMSHVQLEMSHVQLAASASHRPALSSSSLLFLAVGEVVLGIVVRRACRKGIRAIRAGGSRPGYLSRPPSSPWTSSAPCVSPSSPFARTLVTKPCLSGFRCAGPLDQVWILKIPQELGEKRTDQEPGAN